jgi:hypothetical protein
LSAEEAVPIFKLEKPLTCLDSVYSFGQFEVELNGGRWYTSVSIMAAVCQ